MSTENKPRGLRAGALNQSNWSAETRRLNPNLLRVQQRDEIIAHLEPLAAKVRAKLAAREALTITLPLPPAELSPNARCHWAKKAGAVKAYRLRAEVECGTRSERHQAATARIQWYTRTVTHRDPDNALASLKAGIDGVTDSGYMADDRALTFLPIEFAKDASNPRVVLTFTPKL